MADGMGDVTQDFRYRRYILLLFAGQVKPDKSTAYKEKKKLKIFVSLEKSRTFASRLLSTSDKFLILSALFFFVREE